MPFVRLVKKIIYFSKQSNTQRTILRKEKFMSIRYTIVSVFVSDNDGHLQWKTELTNKVNQLIEIDFIPLGNPFFMGNFFNQVLWKPKRQKKPNPRKYARLIREKNKNE